MSVIKYTVTWEQCPVWTKGVTRRDKTGADSVTSFWSSQSVFLIGPHTPATLGTRPGSNVWTIQNQLEKLEAAKAA